MHSSPLGQGVQVIKQCSLEVISFLQHQFRHFDGNFGSSISLGVVWWRVWVLESILGGKIIIIIARELWAIVSILAYRWDAKMSKVSFCLADDWSCESILKFINLYPIREVADSYIILYENSSSRQKTSNPVIFVCVGLVGRHGKVCLRCEEWCLSCTVLWIDIIACVKDEQVSCLADCLKGLEVCIHCHIWLPEEPVVIFGKSVADRKAFSLYLGVALFCAVEAVGSKSNGMEFTLCIWLEECTTWAFLASINLEHHRFPQIIVMEGWSSFK